MTPISFLLFLLLAYKSAFHVDIARCIDCECLFIDNVLLNTIMFVEMILTFFTGYCTKTEIVLDQTRIVKNYLRTYFFFDLMSCMPVTYILNLIHYNEESSSAHLMHDFVMLRIVTVPRFFQFLNLSAEVSIKRLVFNPKIQIKRFFEQYFKLSDIKTRVMRLCCISILFVHLGVCLFKRTYTVSHLLSYDMTPVYAEISLLSFRIRHFSETVTLEWRG